MKRIHLSSLAALAVGAAAVSGADAPPAPRLIGTKEYAARAAAPPDEHRAYGGQPAQFVEVYLPKKGVRPYRTVVFFHGGCWMSQFGLEPVGAFCRALADEAGVAVLNAEYRRVGDEGGGFPGTFLDAAAALDFVDELADEFVVSREKVTVAGHSAGGHLALWLAARAGLPGDDPLRNAVRVRPARVVALAPVADLRDLPATACADAADGLLGPPSLRELRLRSASPAARLPLGVPQVVVAGARDALVPLATVRGYVAKAKAAGDDVSLVEVPGAGHFELVTPGSSAWESVKDAFREPR
jgi:acetyl esterase/lipase